MARQQARRHRRERLTGIVLAVLGVAVLVVAVIALTRPTNNTRRAAASTITRTATPATSTSGKAPTSSSSSPSASARSASASSASTSSSAAGPKSVPLVVLNNTTTAGLAMTAATRFRNGGWTVSSTGNLRNDILSTCAYYDPNVNGAQDAARALMAQFPTIKRVAAKFAQLPSGPVVVVLTPDYSSN